MAYQVGNTHHKDLAWFTFPKHPPSHPLKRGGLDTLEWDGGNQCREAQMAPGIWLCLREERGWGTLGDLLDLLCNICQVRRLKLIPLSSRKLINNSAWQKKIKVPHPHPCSLTLLLSALASPQGSGADRWWKETGSKGGLCLFLVPVLKFCKGTSGRSILCSAFYLLCNFTRLQGHTFPRARNRHMHTTFPVDACM